MPKEKNSNSIKAIVDGNIAVVRKVAKIPFDPEGSGYDYKSAEAAGIKPDKTGHYPSRNYKTGQILKGKKHKTFFKTVAGEKKAGYTIYKGKNGKYYSKPK